MIRKRKKRQWPNFYPRTHRSGEISFVVDLGLVNGKRERHCFTSKLEAQTFAEAKRIERQNEGTAALALSSDTRQDAAKAAAILTPHGVSLLQAAEYYAQHVIAYQNAPPVADITRKMIEDAEKNDRRDRTVSELKSRLSTFAGDFPDRRLSEIAVEEIEEWLDQEDWSPRTRINYLTKLSQLYNYALRHRWVDANIVDRIERPTAEDKEPGIFTVGQAESLLKNAGTFHLLPYISIGLFAGLRAAELLRLEWTAVKTPEQSIVVGVQVAKKRSRRVVEMCPALQAWLRPCVTQTGPIVDAAAFRDHLDGLRKAAGIANWPHNALRHSFASYHLAAFGDAMKTATMLGHKDPGVVHNHYKALVQKSEAERFWNLRPEATPQRSTST